MKAYGKRRLSVAQQEAYPVRDGLNFIYGVQTLYRYPIRNEFQPIGDTL